MTGVLAASDAFSEAAFTALVAGAILAGVPLMFAALGELVSQRAGVLNIGLEGMMLIGAYAGFVAAYHGGSEWFGFAAGAAAGAGVSLLMVLFCVRLGLDQIVVGIAITLLCQGATALIFEAEFAESRPTLGAADKVAIPGVSELPVVGGKGESNGSIFTQPLVVYLGLGLAVLVAWMLRRTHVGLNVRAAGDAPGALDAAGVSVFTTRSLAVLFAGAMAGLGGAYLSIVGSGALPGHGRRRPRVHRHRARHARPRQAVLGRGRRDAVRALAVHCRLGAGGEHGLPSSTSRTSSSCCPSSSCCSSSSSSGVGRTCRPRSRSRTSAEPVERSTSCAIPTSH